MADEEANMFVRKQWPRPDHEEIVNRAKILVIDDGDFPYLKLFRRDGYTVEKWSTVRDLAMLESGKYDVILLDLHGVGRTESPDQGLGVLGHIRKASPAQIVVAYSNAEWSVEYQQFFRSADAVLHKSKDDYMSFKRTVDKLLDQRFSLGFYLDRISRELRDTGVTEATLAKARKAILSGKLNGLRKHLSSRVDDGVVVDRVLAIAQVAVAVAGLWSS